MCPSFLRWSDNDAMHVPVGIIWVYGKVKEMGVYAIVARGFGGHVSMALERLSLLGGQEPNIPEHKVSMVYRLPLSTFPGFTQVAIH